MPKWKFLAHGTKARELILAEYTPGGLIKQVASAYPSRQGYIYNLYPTNYKGHKSISKTTTESIHNIDLRRQQ